VPAFIDTQAVQTGSPAGLLFRHRTFHLWAYSGSQDPVLLAKSQPQVKSTRIYKARPFHQTTSGQLLAEASARDKMAPKSAGAGYAQNRRNHDRAAAEAVQELIPEEYFDETLSTSDYTPEGKALMAAKAYIEVLRVS